MLPLGYAKGDYPRRGGKVQVMLDVQDAEIAALRAQLKDAEEVIRLCDWAWGLLKGYGEYISEEESWSEDEIVASGQAYETAMQAYRTKYGGGD